MAEASASRPATLAEAVRRALAGEQDFGPAIAEFLDGFYVDPDPASRAARLIDRPGDCGTSERDALLGAIGEHLHRRWRLPGAIPAWTEETQRFLHAPWFPDGADAIKAWLIAESPMAFRRRMLFVEAEPLRRARMPQDSRWWTFETLRTGMLPADNRPAVDGQG